MTPLETLTGMLLFVLALIALGVVALIVASIGRGIFEFFVRNQ